MTSQITPLMLRQLWTVVESIQASTIVRLDDASLANSLMREFRASQRFDPDQSQAVNEYIQAKLPLIRDIASQRVPAMNC